MTFISFLRSPLYAWLVSVFALSRSVSAAPAVNVALQASFNSAPYLLELLLVTLPKQLAGVLSQLTLFHRETAAEENATAYFPLLDRIADGYFVDCATDEELYTKFLHTVQNDGHITTPETISSLQFALSVHSAAPRIEAHYQYYRTSVESSMMVAQDAACPVWVHFDGKQYCSPALDRAQQDVDNSRYVRFSSSGQQ